MTVPRERPTRRGSVAYVLHPQPGHRIVALLDDEAPRGADSRNVARQTGSIDQKLALPIVGIIDIILSSKRTVARLKNLEDERPTHALAAIACSATQSVEPSGRLIKGCLQRVDMPVRQFDRRAVEGP
jgi:hypothetical protein